MRNEGERKEGRGRGKELWEGEEGREVREEQKGETKGIKKG